MFGDETAWVLEAGTWEASDARGRWRFLPELIAIGDYGQFVHSTPTQTWELKIFNVNIKGTVCLKCSQ